MQGLKLSHPCRDTCSGWKDGLENAKGLLLTDLRTIYELVEGEDPDQALEHILLAEWAKEDQDLLIKIFGLEETWKAWQD